MKLGSDLEKSGGFRRHGGPELGMGSCDAGGVYDLRRGGFACEFWYDGSNSLPFFNYRS